MKISELKQRQKLKNLTTGEICQVSKRWDGCYLIDPNTRKARYKLNAFFGKDEFGGWEKVA